MVAVLELVDGVAPGALPEPEAPIELVLPPDDVSLLLLVEPGVLLLEPGVLPPLALPLIELVLAPLLPLLPLGLPPPMALGLPLLPGAPPGAGVVVDELEDDVVGVPA